MNIDKLKEIKEIEEQVAAGMETMIPLARKYLTDLRDIRMAFDREIVQIVRSAAQLNEIAKSSGNLMGLADNLERISKVLDSGLREKIVLTFNIGETK